MTKKDEFLKELESNTGNDYSCCYQCGKCTAGCPVGMFMDNPPAKLMRLVQLGFIEEALRSESLWWCLGCQTCTARCPQNMEIAGTLDALRSIAIREGIISKEKSRKLTQAFHDAFLQSVRKRGRLHELSLVNSYKLRTGTFTQDMDAGVKMMLQGKINPFSILTGGEKVEAQEEIDAIFKLAEDEEFSVAELRRNPEKIDIPMRKPVKIDPSVTIGYYPGCSLGGTAKEFDISTRKLCDLLGLEIREIEDWNCCGASSAHSTDHNLAYMLPARNQVLADSQGFDYVLTPCAACLNRQVIARNALQSSKGLREKIGQVMKRDPSCDADFISVTQMLLGLEAGYIRKKVVNPLKHLKLACYYGCLLVRPVTTMGFDDSENPTKMEKLVEAFGAETVDWAFKVECCGAGLTMANPKLIEELTHKIVLNAVESGAEGFVVACPLCHSNLDMRQKSMRKRYGDVPEMPVYYLSELAAIACGADPVEVAVGKHFVPALDKLKE